MVLFVVSDISGGGESFFFDVVGAVVVMRSVRPAVTATVITSLIDIVGADVDKNRSDHSSILSTLHVKFEFATPRGAGVTQLVSFPNDRSGHSHFLFF